MASIRRSRVFIGSNQQGVPPEILEPTKTAGEHPAVFTEAGETQFTSLSHAKHATHVSAVLGYPEYLNQAKAYETPPRPKPEGVEVYFGVDDKQRSLVFHEHRNGVVTVEPACCLHVCDKAAVRHQLSTGAVTSSGRRHLAPDKLMGELIGPSVQVGLPPVLPSVALAVVDESGLPKMKDPVEASFIHVVGQGNVLGFYMRAPAMTPENKTEYVAKMLAGEEVDELQPHMSASKYTRKIDVHDIKATIVADPNAFDLETISAQFNTDQRKIDDDITRYKQLLAKAYPDREILVARNPGELADHYRRFWLHL